MLRLVRVLSPAVVAMTILMGSLSVGAQVQKVLPVKPTVSAPAVMSFVEWKSAKVLESQTRLRKLYQQYVELRSLNPKAPALPLLQQDLAQERWNLEVAQELTARDYLALYVKVQSSRGRLADVAARLTNSEVNALLESYFQLVERTNQAPTKRTRLGGEAL